MKPRAPRIHLLDCESPLTSYSDITVRCGEVLANAAPKFMVELSTAEGLTYLPLSTCKKCMTPMVKEIDPTETRYLYGLVNAQSDLVAQGEEAG